ncbi:hypothetical protein DFJ73DRAFT_908071 [Zopfochytrium polystomum]|nr:hypothetical protein DFJ73DRAFT_908071 [Zopfochytrium polystomum]
MSRKNVVVVGGSFVGMKAAQYLAASLPSSHHVVLVEANSHFNFLFGFTRFSVLRDHHEEKCFVPYTHVFAQHPDMGVVVQASALDRTVDAGDGPTDEVPFAHLVVATGTRLQTPWTMPGTEKTEGVETLRGMQGRVWEASRVVLVGGGAVGVQLAFDIKQLYPEKSVTLVHSRTQLLNHIHKDLSDLVLQRFENEGIETRLGLRVKIPDGGFPEFTPGKYYGVELSNVETIEADLTMLCTGQTPRSSLLASLSPSSLTPTGFIRVRPTLQVQSPLPDAPPLLSRIYAIGDVADSGAMKTMRSGLAHIPVMVANVLAQIAHDETDGDGESVKFGNPAEDGAAPVSIVDADGAPDMEVETVWDRVGVPTEQRDYRL